MAKTSTVTSETEVEDVLNDRPALIRLAQVVFERTTAQYLRAFSRFRKSSDLAALIQAKRDEVFDYGACIVDGDTGPSFPTTEAVLEALELAIDDKLSADDMEALGLTAADFSKVCPGKEGAPKREARGKTSKQEEPKAEEKVEPKAEEKVEQTVTKRVVRKREEPKAEDNVVEFPGKEGDEPVPTTVDLGPVLERIDQLSADLADALHGADSKFDGKISNLAGEVSALRTGLVGIVGLFDVINERLDTIGKYFVDEYIEWPEIPDEVRQAVGTLADAAPAAPVVVEKKEQPKKAAPQPAPTNEDNEDSEDNEDGEDDTDGESPRGRTAQSGDAIEKTREELENMELDELREFASQLGIPRASKIGYKAVAIKKILKAQS